MLIVRAEDRAYRAVGADGYAASAPHSEANEGCAKRMRRAGLLLVVALPISAHAAHPLITEDTATQGRANVELEIGNAWTHSGADRSFELGPQLSYGLLPQLDAILRPTWLDQRSTIRGHSERARGAGDTAADLKWRFFERDPLSLAARAGFSAPTGGSDRGLGSSKPTFHGLLAASTDLAPFAVHSNVGYTLNRADPMARHDLYHASAAVIWTVDATWRLLLAEFAADTNDTMTRSTWPVVARVGVIYTVKRGVDIDLGYRTKVNGAATGRIVLIGVTARWGA